jgi:hypothetical protein
MDHYAGKTIRGEVVAGEFVGTKDEEGREPGIYITIKLADQKTAIVGGPVDVTYLPLPASDDRKDAADGA